MSEEETVVEPFFSVIARAGTEVTVQAGWVNEDGEVNALTMDYTGQLGTAEQAFGLAYLWYANTITAMLEDEEDA